MPTYTSDTLRVSDGEITSHDTTTVGESINILSAECRWQGVNSSNTQTEIYSNNKYPTITDEAQYIDINFPNYNTGENFSRHEGVIYLNEDTNITFDHRYLIHNTNTGNIVEGSSFTEVSLSGTLDSCPLFPTKADNNLNTDYTENKYYLEVIIQPHGSPSADLTIELDTVTTKTVTNNTTDPFVTRDVDGSYSGTIGDGNWTAWQSLSGVAEGVNEFYHNISGSGEAYFEFRYDWEYQYPTAQKQLRISDINNNVIHNVALADPSSANLDYNHVKTSVGGTTYAIDVVAPSDPDAIGWLRMQTQYGEVCPRAYESFSY